MFSSTIWYCLFMMHLVIFSLYFCIVLHCIWNIWYLISHLYLYLYSLALRGIWDILKRIDVWDTKLHFWVQRPTRKARWSFRGAAGTSPALKKVWSEKKRWVMVKRLPISNYRDLSSHIKISCPRWKRTKWLGFSLHFSPEPYITFLVNLIQCWNVQESWFCRCDHTKKSDSYLIH